MCAKLSQCFHSATCTTKIPWRYTPSPALTPMGTFFSFTLLSANLFYNLNWIEWDRKLNSTHLVQNERGKEGSSTFRKPKGIPPARRDQVSKPEMGELVSHHLAVENTTQLTLPVWLVQDCWWPKTWGRVITVGI